MGAFGELLIQHWGGDLKKYKNPTSGYKKQVKKQVKKTELTLEEKKENEQICIARYRLDLLTSKLIYTPSDISNYTEESIKNGFKQLNFNSNIQNLMWDEFVEFKNKYIK
jgi:phenylalanyl-tRNA synthetase alpha subunit